MQLMRQMRCNCIGVAINCRSHKKSAQLQPTTTTRDNIDGEEKKLKRKKQINWHESIFPHWKYFVGVYYAANMNFKPKLSPLWFFISCASLKEKWIWQSLPSLHSFWALRIHLVWYCGLVKLATSYGWSKYEI